MTINDGFIFYAEVNASSSGNIALVKKVNDSRLNRPVGSFVIAKNVRECGTLMFSSFKEKSIGSSLGRLDHSSSNGAQLVDINYIKLHNQGIEATLDSNYTMGNTDFVDTLMTPNQ